MSAAEVLHPQLGADRRPAARGWLLGAAAVVATFVVLGLLGEAFAPAPQGPSGSSYATSAGGVAAWAQLLGDDGHPVSRLRSPLASAHLNAGSTLVVLGGPAPDAAAAPLRRFVSAGGHLVIGGGDPTAALAAIVGDPPTFERRAVPIAHPVAALPVVAGVRRVQTAGGGAFTGVTGSSRAALAGAGGTLLVVAARGRGEVVALADPSAVENRLLASADDAQLALDLAGGPGRPVVFDEALHGYTRATGLAAFPGRWWVTIAGLALAAGAWALARGRRLGPAQRPDPAPVPPRAAYVEAMARALVRGRDRAGLVELARDRDRDRDRDRPASQPAARARDRTGAGR